MGHPHFRKLPYVIYRLKPPTSEPSWILWLGMPKIVEYISMILQIPGCALCFHKCVDQMNDG